MKGEGVFGTGITSTLARKEGDNQLETGEEVLGRTEMTRNGTLHPKKNRTFTILGAQAIKNDDIT